MSEMPQTPEWWQASDGRWYPPVPVPPPPPPLPPAPPPTHLPAGPTSPAPPGPVLVASDRLRPSPGLKDANGSMALGVFGVVFGWLPLFGIVPAAAGPFALFLGFRARRAAGEEPAGTRRRLQGTAMVGIVLGVIATGFLLLWTVAFISSFVGGQDPFRGL